MYDVKSESLFLVYLLEHMHDAILVNCIISKLIVGSSMIIVLFDESLLVSLNFLEYE